MTIDKKEVYGVNGEKASSNIGVFVKRGGVILSAVQNNLDKLLYNYQGRQQYFKIIHVGTGGNLVYLNADNQPDVFFNVPDGGFLPLHGSKVLTSAEIFSYDSSGAVLSSEVVSTTCLNITWHGGE